MQLFASHFLFYRILLLFEAHTLRSSVVKYTLSKCRVYGELYKKIDIIGLNLCGIRRLISDGRAAFFAFIDDYIALFRIRQNLHGTENSLTIVSPVTRVDIYMNRTQALGTVVSGGYSERLYLEAAALADEAVIVFLKAFFFHFV